MNSVLERIKHISAGHVSRRAAEDRAQHMNELIWRGWGPVSPALADAISDTGCPIEVVDMGSSKRDVPWVPAWVVVSLTTRLGKKLSSRHKSQSRAARRRLKQLVGQPEGHELVVADYLLSAGAHGEHSDMCKAWLERGRYGPRQSAGGD